MLPSGGLHDASDTHQGSARMHECRGFSLVELAACVLVAGVVALVALPSMAALVESNRAATTSNRLLGLLMHARTEALKRRTQVSVCPSADSETCLSGTDWSAGLITFQDRNRNGRRDPGEALLRVMQGPDLNGMRLRGSTGRNHVAFRQDGRAGGSNLTLRLCTRNAALARKIIISNGGRARIQAPVAPESC
jgi:type IV fimbrial biogenesis protein FimT